MEQSYVYEVTEAGSLYIRCLRKYKVSTIVKKLKKFHKMSLNLKYTKIRLLTEEEEKKVLRYIGTPLYLF